MFVPMSIRVNDELQARASRLRRNVENDCVDPEDYEFHCMSLEDKQSQVQAEIEYADKLNHLRNDVLALFIQPNRR